MFRAKTVASNPAELILTHTISIIVGGVYSQFVANEGVAHGKGAWAYKSATSTGL